MWFLIEGLTLEPGLDVGELCEGVGQPLLQVCLHPPDKGEDMDDRLNMELDLQSIFGLHVTWCAQLFSLGPRNPLPPHRAYKTWGAIGLLG